MKTKYFNLMTRIENLFDKPEEGLLENASLLAGTEEKGSGSPTVKETKDTEDYKPNPIWNHLKEQRIQSNPEWKLPEEVETGKIGEDTLTPEKELELLQAQFIPEKEEPVNLGISQDDFILSYLDEKSNFEKENPDKTYDPNSFVNQFKNENDVLKLSDDDLLSRVIKDSGKSEQRPDGFTDEQVQDHIAKMTDIEKSQTAGSYRTQINEAREAKRLARKGRVTELSKEKLESINEKTLAHAEVVLSKFQELDKIGELPYGESEKEEFGKVWKTLAEVNPKTGVLRAVEYLNNDENLFQALFLDFMSQGDKESRMTKFISNYKEDFKNELLEKTGLGGQGGGQGAPILPENIQAGEYV